MIHPLISTGDYYSVIVDHEDTLWVAGKGTGTRFTKVPNTPVGILYATCGSDHCILIDRFHRCWSFGGNEYGQLGLGHTMDRDFPTQIEGLTFPVRQVSCGSCFTMCVDFEGNLWTFGSINIELEIGDHSFVSNPQKMMGIPPVNSVSCRFDQKVIIDQEGFVWTVGANGSGKLGIGNYADQFEPIKLIELTSIVQVSSGHGHTLALGSDGRVWSFGWNQYGQLGHSYTDLQTSPKLIPNIPSMKLVHCNGNSSFTMDFDGNWWSCGENSDGQLGRDFIGDSLTQVQTFPKGTTAISNGSQCLCSIVVDSEGRCWGFGENSQGTLGVGDTDDRFEPTLIDEPKIKVKLNTGGSLGMMKSARNVENNK